MSHVSSPDLVFPHIKNIKINYKYLKVLTFVEIGMWQVDVGGLQLT